MTLNLTAADATIDIGSYQLVRIPNVTTYTLCGTTFNTWIVQTDSTLSDISSTNVYFVIDLCFDEAFGHWVYESAIYLPLFCMLKVTYPTLKLVLKTKKNFKHLFCSYFNIAESDIVYHIPTTESNLCFFPSPISSLNITNPNSKVHEYYTSIFRLFKECPSIKKDPVEYLIMPRQTIENYKGNDRTIPFQAIFDHFTHNTTNTHRIFHTDTVTNLIDQINELRSAKTIICHDGSALLVNGMFVQNKQFLVVSLYTPGQASKYPQLSKIIEYINKINNNTIQYFSIDRDVVNYVMNYR